MSQPDNKCNNEGKCFKLNQKQSRLLENFMDDQDIILDRLLAKKGQIRKYIHLGNTVSFTNGTIKVYNDKTGNILDLTDYDQELFIY